VEGDRADETLQKREAEPLANHVPTVATRPKPHLKDEANASKVSSDRGFSPKPIYFQLDKDTLMPEGKQILKEVAVWLKTHPDISVQIQGHCDERGTHAYNMALGAQRAWNVKKYLVGLGIPARQLGTVSFGKERPVDSAHTEKAWAKNRRAEIVIQKN
jgi:peptidoglycan-associated lipoprotein